MIRDRAVLEPLESPTTLPVGFGGERPHISERTLLPGDRLLCFTDGLIEERQVDGELFGEHRLIESTDRVLRDYATTRAVARKLPHTLKDARGGVTSDDSTLFLVEWRGGTSDHLAVFD